MKKLFTHAPQPLARLLVLLLVMAPLAHARPARLLAQSAAASSSQEDTDAEKITFDNLLAASSYALYIEARDIGQHARAGSFSEIIEPLAPMAEQLPKEIDALLKFIAANADALMHSRLMIALEPVRPQLPPMLIAVELASPDVAHELEPKLRQLVSLMMPSAHIKHSNARNSTDAAATPQPDSDSYIVFKRAGKLLIFSPMPFKLNALRTESDKLMTDDGNFRAARDRFYAEPFFLYYDMALSARVLKERKEAILQQDEETENQLKSAKRAPAPSATLEMPGLGTPLAVNEAGIAIATEAASSSTLPSATNDVATERASQSEQQAGTSDGPPSTAAASAVSATAAARASATTKPSRGRRAGQSPQPATVAPSPTSAAPTLTNVAPPPPPPPPEVAESRSPNLFDYLMRVVFASRATNESQAEALALALTLENDAIILRAFMITAPGVAASPIPFLALPISGPAQSSEAANYLPADTDVFITASLDLAKLYDLTLARAKETEEMMALEHVRQKPQPSFASQVAAFEKANGFRVRDELLATLGNEIAVGLPASYLSDTPLGRMPLKSQAAQTGPVMLIGVRNREMLEAKLKPVLEALGMKRATEKGVIEKHGDIEITSYSQAAVAFINNYLVIGNNTATVRRVIEARAKNETLATNRDFHSYMQWQPRETIAQVYVSAAVLKGLFSDPASTGEPLAPDVKEFLARFRFEPEPVTYAASADGMGAFYELRLPKKLVLRALAEISATEMRYRIPRNEMMAQSILQALGEMEKMYHSANGRYATLDELKGFQQTKDVSGHEAEMAFPLFEMMERFGYKIELTVSGNGYEATATPIEYGKHGKLSFYMDQSGQIRRGDHGGKPATAKDKSLPVDRDN